MAADTSGRVRHIDYMDGLRGVLVLGVLCLHIFYAATLLKGPMPWYNYAPLWFQPSINTMGFFVVISGYCLMLPVARSKDKSLSKGGIPAYLKRRFWRIVPPYYVAAILSLAHITLFSKFYTRYLGINTNPWHAGVLWSHLLLFYNFSPHWRFQINSPYWALAPEWQLYLLFPVVLVPLWRKFGLGALLGAAFVVSVGLVLSSDAARQMHPWFLLLFAAGMAGSVVSYSEEPRMVALRNRVPWSMIACVLFGVFVLEWVGIANFRPQVFAHMPSSWQQYCGNETLLGFAILCSILHWHKVQIHTDTEMWPHVLWGLNHRSVRWLGTFSYSLYLVHWPIVITMVSLIRSLGLKEVPTLIVAYAVGAPVSIGLGYLFFLAVERRFLPEAARKAIPRVQPEAIVRERLIY